MTLAAVEMEAEVIAPREMPVSRLAEWFESAEDATDLARRLSERDRDYFDNWQLTDAQVAELRRRGQPPVVINRIQRKIEWLKGLEAQRRTDPRAFPRTPQHQQGSEAASDAIKFVCDKEDFDQTAAAVWENMLIEGFGGGEVVHREGPTGVEVVINYYPWDRLFYDPHSGRPDFGDARYKGAVIWVDADDLKQAYPDQGGGVDELMRTSAGRSDTYDDRPQDTWADARRKRVRLVMMHYLDAGEWRWCLFSGSMVFARGVSPYVDEHGASVCPLIMQSAYVDRENRRYGAVRTMVDIQDEINKRRSKALHLLSQRQTMGDKGAVESVAGMKRELARPDGHVEVMPGMRFEPLQTGDMVSGHFALLQEAKNEIDLLGANNAMQGEGPAQSGRAVLARQQGGLVEIAPLLDRFSMFKRNVYRAVWQRIRQFWTEERWIRVTDEEKNARFVSLNHPVTLEEHLLSLPEEEARALVQELQILPGDPRLGEVVAVKADVASLDVDIILDEAPEAMTLQGETFNAIVSLAGSGAVPVPPEMIVEMAPGLRREQKDKILDLMKAQQDAAAQQQQAIAPLGEAQAMADLEKTQSEAQRNAAMAAQALAKARSEGAFPAF